MSTDPAAGEVIRVMSSGRPLMLSNGDGRLRVSTARGEALDPVAAEVLLALGGDEPPWLRAVEGLEAAYSEFGLARPSIDAAAEAVGRKPQARAELARTSDDPAVLITLAGAGQPQVVCNSNLTPHMWDLVAGHRDPRVREKALALVDTLPPHLAASEDPAAKLRVARNPDCPADTLDELASTPDESVQAAVARNPSTREPTFTRLGQRASQPVLAAMAANPSTPADWLSYLARQKHITVRTNVASNPSTPRSTRTKQIWDANGQVRYALAARDDLGPASLSWIERYARRDALYRQTCTRLQHNQSCTPRLRRRLEASAEREKQVEEWRRIHRQEPSRPPEVRLRWILGQATAFVILLVSVSGLIGLVEALTDLNGLAALLALSVSGLSLWGALRLARWARRSSGPPSRRAAPPPPQAAFLLLGFYAAAVAIGAAVNPAAAVAFIAIPILLGRVKRRRRRSAGTTNQAVGAATSAASPTPAIRMPPSVAAIGIVAVGAGFACLMALGASASTTSTTVALANIPAGRVYFRYPTADGPLGSPRVSCPSPLDWISGNHDPLCASATGGNALIAAIAAAFGVGLTVLAVSLIRKRRRLRAFQPRDALPTI